LYPFWSRHFLIKKSGTVQEDNRSDTGDASAMIITYEHIAKRAFEIWKKDGEPEGREQEHWLRAEAELRSEGSKSEKGKKLSSKDPTMLKTPR
jgi:DUF2934 family protein